MHTLTTLFLLRGWALVVLSSTARDLSQHFFIHRGTPVRIVDGGVHSTSCGNSGWGPTRKLRL